MQIYTHALLGGVFAVACDLHPDTNVAFVVGAIGGITPDLGTFLPDLFKKGLKGMLAGMRQQTKSTMKRKEILHSILVWTTLLFPAYLAAALSVNLTPEPLLAFKRLLLPFAFGGVLHVWVDVFTHGDPDKDSFEPSYVWPLGEGFKLGRKFGFWDYRYAHGKMWPPKSFEAVVGGVTLIYAVLYFDWKGLLAMFG